MQVGLEWPQRQPERNPCSPQVSPLEKVQKARGKSGGDCVYAADHSPGRTGDLRGRAGPGQRNPQKGPSSLVMEKLGQVGMEEWTAADMKLDSVGNLG